MKIPFINHLRECIIKEWAKINGNTKLLHHIHINITKHIELYIFNGEHYVEDIIEIIIVNNVIKNRWFIENICLLLDKLVDPFPYI